MSNLLLDESPLVVQPSLAVLLGLNEAIVLQQIHYWLNPKFNKNFEENRYWVHKTYKQWCVEFPFFSEKTVRRVITNLEEKGIILSRNISNKFDKTKTYSINYERLESLKTQENQGSHPCGQSDHMDLPKRAVGTGQSDQTELVNLTTSYIKDKITLETTLPLPKGSSLQNKKNQKEEEEDVLEKSSRSLAPKNPYIDPNQNSQPLPEKALELWNNHVQIPRGDTPLASDIRAL